MTAPRHRRHVVSIAVASAAAAVVLPAAFTRAQLTTDIVKGSLSIGLEPVTDIGDAAIDLTHAGDTTDRYFIAGQTSGDVRVFKNGAGGLVTTPFLDTNGTTGSTGAALSLIGSGERGLLGMAFHPNFAVPGQPGFGKFYTYTSETKGGSLTGVDYVHAEHDATNGGDHDSVIREWTVNPANPDQVLIDTTSTTTRQNSGRVVMRIRQPQSNHNGGAMKFGPDGMLYIALGDGGGSNDQFGTEPDGHTDSPVNGNAQDVSDYALARNENVLGKILRIDPRAPGTTSGSTDPASTNGQYRIPADNPRMGTTDGADEIYAYGLRNPFRMSFDRGGTNQLYVGDVGQGQREEIDIVTKGGNYGWVYWEGTRVNFAEPAGGITEIAPIGEYTHSDGQAVIGGFVYRGNNIPELQGRYIFGELDFNDPATPEVDRGRIFYMNGAGGTISEFNYLLSGTDVTAPTTSLYAFGEDRDGELYALFADGTVKRILGRQWYATTGGTWGDANNWLGGVPNASGAVANFLGRVTSAGSTPAVINLDGSRTVGSILFNNNVGGAGVTFRVAQGTGGNLSITNGASTASVKVIKGNHEITAPVTISGNTEIDVAAAAASLTLTNLVSVGGTRTLTHKGPGPLGMTGGLSMLSTSVFTVTGGVATVRNIAGGTVNVTGPGRVNVSANAGPLGTSKVNALNVTGGGKLDLSNNKFIVINGNLGTAAGGTYSGLSGLVQSGYAAGAWNGPGVMTSQPDAASGLTAIGIATADQIGRAGTTFSGQSVAANDVIIMYTYGGDANLDGQVSGDDYSAIDFNILVPGSSGWVNGDFNYDGAVTGDDYSTIDFNILAQGAPFSTSGVAAQGLTSVPEPASLMAAVGLTPLAFARRRRRK